MSAAPSRPRREMPGGPWASLLSTLRGAGRLRSALAGLVVLASAGALVWVGERGRQEPGPIPAGEPACSLSINGRAVSGGTAAARSGDTLRLALAAPARIPYAVLYRDDGGPAGVLVAPDPGRAAGSPGGERLPGSRVLADGWKTSTLFCVTSDRPFTLEEAEALAGRLDGEGGTEAGGLRAQVFRIENAAGGR